MTSDGTGNTGLISLYCRVPTPLEDHIVMDMASLLDEEAISTSWEKDTELGVDKGWTLMWVLENLPAIPNFLKSLSKISGLKITEDHLAWQNVPDVNWLEESYKSFPPFRVGPFFVHGSHFDGKIPKGLMPLQIDAATAFGSGEHGTTRGCLDALIKLHKSGFKPKTILDMGSGSGILAIAAYKLWKKPVLAVDIDKEATKVAVRHRTNIPQLRADMTRPEVADFVELFGDIPVLSSPGNPRSLRAAAVSAGIPTVTMEAGEPMRLQRDMVDVGVKEVMTLMAKSGMYSGVDLWLNPAPAFYDSAWVRANASGILFSSMELGAQVGKGDVLGVINNPITNEQIDIVSPHDGRILGMALDQFVMPGFAVYHIGIHAAKGTQAQSLSEEDAAGAGTYTDQEADEPADQVNRATPDTSDSPNRSPDDMFDDE